MTLHFVLVAPSMAAGQELQAAFLEIDRRLNTLKALHDHMEREEARADAGAFRTE